MKVFGYRHRIISSLRYTIQEQKRVTYSTFGTEILAAADAEDGGFHLKKTFEAIYLPLSSLTKYWSIPVHFLTL